MDFPEPDKIPEMLQKLLEAAGVQPPLWLTRTITWLVLLGVLLCAVWGLLYVLSKIKELAAEFIPPRLNRETRRRLARRRRLDEEFGKGLEEGTWLFLFDSFDEIPEILGSTEPDAVIRQYTRAIEDFLHGMNRCRGVVASRFFRGPGQVQWPRFRILPLSPECREDLVRKADLPTTVERELLGQLPFVVEQMGDQAKNPLFLGLICEHMKSGRPFPENGHTLFESYIDQRLTRDKDRIARRLRLEVTTIRSIAEQVAFCMAADQGLGLSPARERIPEVMARQGFERRLYAPFPARLFPFALGYRGSGHNYNSRIFFELDFISLCRGVFILESEANISAQGN